MSRITAIPLDAADILSEVWSECIASAPSSYPVTGQEFSAGFVVDPAEDESLAVSASQELLVAMDGSDPVGFAHLCAGKVEVDGQDVNCGIIRFLAFKPESRSAGQDLLEASEAYLQDQGCVRVDVFSLYHGYPFHNHRVGTLSSKLDHVGSLLTENAYLPHDGHRTLERPLDGTLPLSSDCPAELSVELTEGAGAIPDIRIGAQVDGKNIGWCRSMNGLRYAAQDDLGVCAYTRHLAVNADYRRQGIGVPCLHALFRR
jgi:GNAT superfamily N-acetyltransferase